MAIISVPSIKNINFRPDENALMASGEKPLIEINNPRVLSSLRCNLPEKASKSSIAVNSFRHFASNKYSSLLNVKAPSICSPVILKDDFGAKSYSKNKSFNNFLKHILLLENLLYWRDCKKFLLIVQYFVLLGLVHLFVFEAVHGVV